MEIIFINEFANIESNLLSSKIEIQNFQKKINNLEIVDQQVASQQYPKPETKYTNHHHTKPAAPQPARRQQSCPASPPPASPSNQPLQAPPAPSSRCSSH